MIHFTCRTNPKTRFIGSFRVDEGADVLNIKFDKEDVMQRDDGSVCINVFGPKLKALRDIISSPKFD